MELIPKELLQVIIHFLLPSLGIDTAHLEKLGEKEANQLLHRALLKAFEKRIPEVEARMTHAGWFPLPSKRKDDPGENPPHSLLGTAIYLLWESTIQVPQSDKIADLFKKGQFAGVHKKVDPAKFGAGKEKDFLTAVDGAVAELTFPD